MARNSKNQNSQPKAPDYLAWHIQQKGEQSFWTRIGACWLHKDKKGHEPATRHGAHQWPHRVAPTP